MLHNDLRLLTLGGLRVDGGGDEVAALNRQRRKLAVLAVLALAKRPLARDALVAMFWGDQDEARARHSLTEALSHIRRALGRDAIAVRLTEVSLAAAAALPVDALEFGEAATAGDHPRATSLYEGAFLEGVHLGDAPAFNDWADRQRARLQGLFVRSAAHECLSLARARRWADCALLAERWLDADPASVDAALYRLNALKADGDRTALMQSMAEFERLRLMLRRDFDLEPDPAVTALADDVARRLEALPAAEMPSTPARTSGVGAPPIANVEPARNFEEVSATRDPAPPGNRRRAVAFAGALAAMLVVAGVMTARFRETARRSSKQGGVALAVMPFAYIGTDSTQAYLAEGLTEELNAALGGVPGVRIIANGGAHASGDARARAAMARSVGADAVIDGSVRSGAGRVRVTVRLLSAERADQLWAETYERDASDALTVEREIASSVVGALESRLGVSVGVLATRQPVDPVTHDLYLRGRYFENRSGVVALDRAADYFRQAIHRDSTYAPAWAGLAGVSLTKFNWGFSYGETVTPARAFIERALALDPQLSDAHATYARLLRDDWRWLDAAREFERALALNPSDVDARHALSHLYFALQRPDDALAEARRALALDPLNPRIGMHLCVALTVSRQYPQALEACRRGIELDASFPDSHAKLAWVLLRLGRLPEARRELDREISASGRTSAYLIQSALLDAYDGHTDRARSLADSLLRATPPARLQYPLLSLVYAKLGDRGRTLAMLEAAVMAHSDEAEEIVIAPELDPIRDDPAYRRIVQQLGLARATGRR